MSVPNASLSTREGSLLSVSISADPRHLELLLEALAQVPFPINPQIYHEAAFAKVYPDGSEEFESTTLVEFPAYQERLREVQLAIEAYGFAPESMIAVRMLDEIHSASRPEPAPAGSPYSHRYRIKRRAALAHAV